MSLFHLRTTNQQFLGMALALKRVDRGIKWLNAHAPSGWHLRFFRIHPDGVWTCRARDASDNECALAIAFETKPEYANDYGYVTYAMVMNGLRPYETNGNRMDAFERSHGFTSDFVLIDAFRQYGGLPPKPGPRVTSEMLDEAWKVRMQRFHYDRVYSSPHFLLHELRVAREESFATKKRTRPSLASRILRGLGIPSLAT